MAISVQCGACRSSYSLSDKFAGSAVTCPNCQASISVPVMAAQLPIQSSVLAGRRNAPSVAAIAGQALTKRWNLRFRGYVTGELAVVLWWASVVGFFGYCLWNLRLAAEFPGVALFQIFAGMLAMLALRITLETVSVLFDVAHTLHEIRDKNNAEP